MRRVGFIAVLLVLIPARAFGQEGHPLWWWECQQADFIVAGEITYDASKYYEVKPVGIDKKVAAYYLIVGEISISKVLYINKHSRHLESYQQYLKQQPSKFPVLIRATGRSLDGTVSLHPLLYDLPTGPTVFALSQVFLFPFNELSLEDGVPVGNVNEAMKLITARPNNFLSK